MFKRFLPSLDDSKKIGKDFLFAFCAILALEYLAKYAAVSAAKYAACKFFGFCAKSIVA